MTWRGVTDKDLTELEERVDQGIFAEFVTAANADQVDAAQLATLARRTSVTKEAVAEIRRIIHQLRKQEQHDNGTGANK